MKPLDAPPPSGRGPSLWPAAGILLALHLIPYANYALLPVTYLDTHLHEMMHAVAAFATGGRAFEILVHGDGSGLTFTSGGSALVISSAGYLGSTALGLAIVLLSRTPEAARTVLRGLGILLAVAMALLVRGDFVGIATGVFWVFALLLAGSRLKGNAALLCAQVIGLAQVLASLGSLTTLFFLSLSPDRGSDAVNLAQATGVPAIVWSVLWAGTALAATAYALRHHSRRNAG